jgi:hypothetical protein
MNATPRLSLPFISPGQAQKELLHNEALQRLDLLVAAAVEEPPRVSPPEAPQIGQCFLVGTAADGDWAGADGCVAAYTSGGWRTVPPPDGMLVYVRSAGLFAIFRRGAWELGAVHCSSVIVGGEQVVGQPGAPIAGPAGGGTVDAEARTAIDGILSALRAHGLVKT